MRVSPFGPSGDELNLRTFQHRWYGLRGDGAGEIVALAEVFQAGELILGLGTITECYSNLW